MSDDFLTKQFDESRAHLRAVAFRMLGSSAEAEDAVQEAWLKSSRADTQDVANLRGWLTTVVARVCLDMLRARRSRTTREEEAGVTPIRANVDSDLAIADAIGPALVIVLETLAPAERVAFVLHDMFDLSFEEIAPIVDRSPAAARQLASRARRRVRGKAAPEADLARRSELVGAFLAASRDGDFDRLVAVLAPDAVLRADAQSLAMAAQRAGRGAPDLAPEVHGAPKIAAAFKGRAAAAKRATIDGEPGAVWMMGGQVKSAFVFAIEDGKIVEIDLVMDPVHIAALDVRLD